jgi:hypothetical protein
VPGNRRRGINIMEYLQEKLRKEGARLLVELNLRGEFWAAFEEKSKDRERWILLACALGATLEESLKTLSGLLEHHDSEEAD